MDGAGGERAVLPAASGGGGEDIAQSRVMRRMAKRSGLPSLLLLKSFSTARTVHDPLESCDSSDGHHCAQPFL